MKRWIVLIGLLASGWTFAQSGNPGGPAYIPGPPFIITSPSSGQCLVFNGTVWANATCGGGGGGAFSGVTAGTNTNALVVGTGGSFTASGTGTITATSVPATGVTAGALPSGVTTTGGSVIDGVTDTQTLTNKNITLPGGTWGAGALAANLPPLYQNTTITGTSTGAGFGVFTSQTDNSSNTPIAYGMYENLILGGSSVLGNREAGQFNLNINAATANNSGHENYVGLGSKCIMNATDTPTGGSSCFGMNPVATAAAGVTAEQIVGTEIDTTTGTGAVIHDRIALQISGASASNTGVQATRDDVAISINSNQVPSATMGYLVGIELGRAGGYPSVATTGTIFGGQGNSGTGFTVANGIDWHLGTFTGNSWNDGQTTMSGAGVVTTQIFNGKATDPFQVNGVDFILQGSQAVNPSTFIGIGAGAAQTLSTTIFNVGIGWHALNALTTGNEDTCIGELCMPYLTTGIYDTCVGQHCGGNLTVDSGSTYLGNDSCRNCSVTNGYNVGAGKNAMYTGAPLSSVAIGAQSGYGNSTSITLTGTVTTGDTVTLTVTSGLFATQTASYTAVGGDTLANVAAGLVTALNANSTITNAGAASVAINGATGGYPNTIQLQYTGTCTNTNGAGICVTAGVSGSATEIVTIGGGNTGSENIALGYQANPGFQLTTANQTIGIGKWTLAGNTTGSLNTAIQVQALQNNTTGQDNIAIGVQSLSANTTGGQSTCVGDNTCTANTTVNGLTALGYHAAKNATLTGITAVGQNALAADTTAANANNTCVGSSCGILVTTGAQVTGVGFAALASLVTNGGGTAVGWKAATNATGNNVTGIGTSACSTVTTGSSNTCLGSNVGSSVLTTGSNNILIGSGAAAPAITTVAAATTGEINIGGLIFQNATSVAVPVISACGTSPTVDTHANSRSGTVTVGTTAATCTITFASAYVSWNHCRVTSQSNLAAFAYSYTLSAITTTATVLGGDLIDYDCDGV